jgi:Lon protease-like protein
MSEGQSISVNFGREMPIFALDSVVLLPQQVLPLHIFEDRYIQMVQHVLDGSGQIAMAVVSDNVADLSGDPPIKPAVCVGQIVQHEALPDGRFNILIQGICRARVREDFRPVGDRLYRAGLLEPLGEPNQDSAHLHRLREWIEDELSGGSLRRLTVAEHVVEYVRNEEVPNAAVLELISFALLSDHHLRYRLLAEGDMDRRATMIERELQSLSALIRRAEGQKPEDWPKGCSWN